MSLPKNIVSVFVPISMEKICPSLRQFLFYVDNNEKVPDQNTYNKWKFKRYTIDQINLAFGSFDQAIIAVKKDKPEFNKLRQAINEEKENRNWEKGSRGRGQHMSWSREECDDIMDRFLRYCNWRNLSGTQADYRAWDGAKEKPGRLSFAKNYPSNHRKIDFWTIAWQAAVDRRNVSSCAQTSYQNSSTVGKKSIFPRHDVKRSTAWTIESIMSSLRESRAQCKIEGLNFSTKYYNRWAKSNKERPSIATVLYRFGSWSFALQAIESGKTSFRFGQTIGVNFRPSRLIHWQANSLRARTNLFDVADLGKRHHDPFHRRSYPVL